MAIQSMFLKRAALVAGAAVLLGACSSSPSAADRSPVSHGAQVALSDGDGALIDSRLGFLAQVSSITLMSDDAASSSLAALDAELPSDSADLAQFMSTAGDEQSPLALDLTLKDTTIASLTLRSWQSDSGSASLARAVGPDGTEIVYGERTLIADGSMRTELYLLDVSGFRMVFARESSLSAGDSSSGDGTSSGSSLKLQSFWGTTACDVCADGLLAFKGLGWFAALAAMTRADITVCGLLGVPAEEIAASIWLATGCHAAAIALATGATIPLAFDGRAALCNDASSGLGGGNICQ